MDIVVLTLFNTSATPAEIELLFNIMIVCGDGVGWWGLPVLTSLAAAARDASVWD